MCVCVCLLRQTVFCCRIFVFTVMRLDHGRLDGCLDCSVSLHVHYSFMRPRTLDFLSLSLSFFFLSPALCSDCQSCQAFWRRAGAAAPFSRKEERLRAVKTNALIVMCSPPVQFVPFWRDALSVSLCYDMKRLLSPVCRFETLKPVWPFFLLWLDSFSAPVPPTSLSVPLYVSLAFNWCQSLRWDQS